MKRTIYKYPINIGRTTIKLPDSHSVIHAGSDPGGRLCIWVELDYVAMENGQIYEYEFIVLGTGHMFDNELIEGEDFCHIQSFIDGGFVWHLYGLW